MSGEEILSTMVVVSASSGHIPGRAQISILVNIVPARDLPRWAANAAAHGSVYSNLQELLHVDLACRSHSPTTYGQAYSFSGLHSSSPHAMSSQTLSRCSGGRSFHLCSAFAAHPTHRSSLETCARCTTKRTRVSSTTGMLPMDPHMHTRASLEDLGY